ncbi:MAG TPA: hypothetical protein VL651_11050 [Bacteroidia bacterium]|jgi:hypothetical protein|nr:hypothetical protein [Bacteroidia bacterium]
MTKHFLFLILLAGFHVKISAQTDCSSVHNGKFVAAEMNSITVVRDSTTQTEYNALDGTYVKMSVEWTGDCTYILRYIDSDKKGEKKEWKKLKYLEVNITDVTADGYSYTCSSPGLPAVIRGKLLKK